MLGLGQMDNSYCPEPSRHSPVYPMPTQPLPGNFQNIPTFQKLKG